MTLERTPDEELSALQAQMARALRCPTSLEHDPEWRAFAEQHIQGAAGLEPAARLEIYREQFWLRHTSALVEDFPGLTGILGQSDWERLAEQYLSEIHPSSYTLRDLGQALPQLIERATWLEHQALCLDMARLELAYIDAFDAAEAPPLDPSRLMTVPPEELAEARLLVAPHVRLLRVSYPVAELRRALRTQREESVPIPPPQGQALVVYRKDLRLWDKAISPVAFALLDALARGKSFAESAQGAAPTQEDALELELNIGAWLQDWTAKGLICDIVLLSSR